MEWIEVSTYDKVNHKLSYDNQSTHPKVKKIFINHGDITFIPKGDKTERIISGELRVPVKVLGMIAEKIIYKTAKRVLEEEANALRKFIQSQLS